MERLVTMQCHLWTRESEEDSFVWLRLHRHRVTNMWLRALSWWECQYLSLSIMLQPHTALQCINLAVSTLFIDIFFPRMYLLLTLDLNSIRLLIMLIVMENSTNASHSSLSGTQKSNKHQGHQTHVRKGAVWPSVCILYTLWNCSLRAAGIYLASEWQLNKGFQLKSSWYRAVHNLPRTNAHTQNEFAYKLKYTEWGSTVLNLYKCHRTSF